VEPSKYRTMIESPCASTATCVIYSRPPASSVRGSCRSEEGAAAAITLLVLALSLFGDSLRDALDPTQRR
jgi:hypothetical protein